MLLCYKEHLEGQSLDQGRRGTSFYVIILYGFTWNSQIALIGLLCLGTKCENQFHPSYPAFPSPAPNRQCATNGACGSHFIPTTTVFRVPESSCGVLDFWNR